MPKIKLIPGVKKKGAVTQWGAKIKTSSPPSCLNIELGDVILYVNYMDRRSGQSETDGLRVVVGGERVAPVTVLNQKNIIP